MADPSKTAAPGEGAFAAQGLPESNDNAATSPAPMAQAGGEDLYAVIGVPPVASRDQIRDAYYALAKSRHPDSGGSDPGAADRFGEISQAAAILRDPAKRELYDRGDIDEAGRPKPAAGLNKRRGNPYKVFAYCFFAAFVVTFGGAVVLLRPAKPVSWREGYGVSELPAISKAPAGDVSAPSTATPAAQDEERTTSAPQPTATALSEAPSSGTEQKAEAAPTDAPPAAAGHAPGEPAGVTAPVRTQALASAPIQAAKPGASPEQPAPVSNPPASEAPAESAGVTAPVETQAVASAPEKAVAAPASPEQPAPVSNLPASEAPAEPAGVAAPVETQAVASAPVKAVAAPASPEQPAPVSNRTPAEVPEAQPPSAVPAKAEAPAPASPPSHEVEAGLASNVVQSNAVSDTLGAHAGSGVQPQPLVEPASLGNGSADRNDRPAEEKGGRSSPGLEAVTMPAAVAHSKGAAGVKAHTASWRHHRVLWRRLRHTRSRVRLRRRTVQARAEAPLQGAASASDRSSPSPDHWPPPAN